MFRISSILTNALSSIKINSSNTLIIRSMHSPNRILNSDLRTVGLSPVYGRLTVFYETDRSKSYLEE